MYRCTCASVCSARARSVGARFGACLAAAAVALVAVSACQQSGAGEQPPVPNWNDPIGGPVEVSMAAAQMRMPFHLRSLPEFPRPRRIWDTPALPPAIRVIVLQYRTSSGLVDVYEELPQVGPREFRKVIASWVGLNGQPGTSGTATAVMVRGRYPGLMTTTAGANRSDIRWIEAGVEYSIRGPSLTKHACLRFADELAA